MLLVNANADEVLKVTYEIDTKGDGRILKHYSTGQIKKILNFKNYRNTGVTRLYLKSGKVYQETFYKNNKITLIIKYDKVIFKIKN